MSVISWRSGSLDRVCRSATCAETRAMVDTDCFPCGINGPRCWETAVLISLPMLWLEWYLVLVRLTAWDCMTKCNIPRSPPKGKGASCRRVSGLDGRIRNSLCTVLRSTLWCTTCEQSCARYRDRASCFFLDTWTTLEVIFGPRFVSSKKRRSAGIGRPQPPSEEGLNVEGPKVSVGTLLV